MSEPEDVLSREVALAAKIDEAGITVRAKSRAVAAFDRLLGSLADWPAAFAEGRADKRRLQDQIERRMMEAQADIAQRQLRGVEQVGDALLIDIMKSEGRKQTNTAGVAIEAMEALKALPPPDTAETEAVPETPEALDPDWLNQFTRFAEDASSDQLQQLWGRVLAGEVNCPGSFSRHTLRFVAELDRETAEHCEFAVEYVVDRMIPKTDSWQNNQFLMAALDLQRLGLLEGVGTFGLTQNYDFTGQPRGFLKDGHVLVVHGESGAKFSVEAMLLTRLGVEVFSLLKAKNPTTALRSLAKLIENKPAVERIELGTTRGTGASLKIENTETLWTKSA